jgi:GAF domain-containing protein
MVDGVAEVWLDENLFRLPYREEERVFPPRPTLPGMRRALKKMGVYARNGRGKTDNSATYAAVPLEDQGLLLGALQVTRPDRRKFTKDELDLLSALARIVAVGLYASHRAEVERFRLGQLNLVRAVSAQIANVLEVDELARRVTKLIQESFNYYYVAIFTLDASSSWLRFRSSASAPARGRRRQASPLRVERGQGLIGESAQSGQRLLCEDVRGDPHYRYVDSLPETRSEVAIPLKVEERVLGVLDVQSDRLNGFHPNDLLVLDALADNVARAVESARLYGDLRRRADQLTLIAEVSKSLTSTLDMRELMRDAASLIHDRFGYPFVHVFSVHQNRRLIEYVAGSGKRARSLEGYAIDLDQAEGMIALAARTGETLLSNDVSTDERYRPSPLPPRNTRSELAVPLKFNNQVIGLLDIQSDKGNAFSEDDRFLFEAVADSIASAMRNADLYRSEHWRRQVADSLREVAGLISANVGVDQVLETVLVELERNLAVDVSAIWLLGEDGMYLAAVHGADPVAIEKARLNSPDAAIALASAMLASEPVIRRPGDMIGPSGAASGFPDDYSALSAPLRVGEEPAGLIVLAHHSPGRYGHEAQDMVATFASNAAVAIENARLYDAAQEQAYASAALLQVAQAVASLNELDGILATIVRIMPILVGVERAALYLGDATEHVFTPCQQYGLAEAALAAMWHEFPAGSFRLLDATRQENRVLTQVLRGKGTTVNWLRVKPDLEGGESHLRSDRRLLIAVPLAIKSDLFGVLLVEEAQDARRFRARRIEIINGIAQQAALAIQNDRLQREMVIRERLETEVYLARQIQQTFIPETLPSHPAWQISATWRLARQVGGDFYDVMELPDDRLGLFIADVADKGIPAALFMALTRTLVRAAVIETDSPAKAMRRVNDLLVPDTQQGMFVTAFYAVLETETGSLTYTNAGHNPPLVLRGGGGPPERLTRTGVALGAMEQAPMQERTIQLGPGDSLLLYTDGLTEAGSSDGELFGEGRLEDALRSARIESAEHVLHVVEQALNAFIQSTPLGDDLTMLALRRLES